MQHNTFASCSSSADDQPILCRSTAKHRTHYDMDSDADVYLLGLLNRCWCFARWEDVQQAALEDAAIHSRHGSACILCFCKLHIPNAS